MTLNIPILATRASRDFNERLAAVLGRVAGEVEDALGANFHALVLGGPWGRLEGSAVAVNGHEVPYLPIDIYPVVNEHRGVDADLWKPILVRHDLATSGRLRIHAALTPDEIARLPGRVDWHTLVHGHLVLAGNASVFGRNCSEAARRPPEPIEAVRLLLDSGVVLVRALRVARGYEEAPEPDFVRRTFHDTILAMGDAVLVAHGRFRPQWAHRDDRLDELSRDSAGVRKLSLVHDYRLALVSLLYPDDCWIVYGSNHLMNKLAQRWGSVFLHVEGVRNGRSWGSMADYLRDGALHEDEESTPARWLSRVRQSWHRGQAPDADRLRPSRQLACELPGALGLVDAPQDWPEASARLLQAYGQENVVRL